MPESKENNKYDVIIIGGGPAGLSAGLYTARAKLETLLIEKDLVGGQIVNAEWIENYPGFPEGISGLELGDLMHKQASKYGLTTIMGEVLGVNLQREYKTVQTTEGDFSSEILIVAAGSARQKLDIPGEDEYTGRGVSYCATCDAAFFRDQVVAVAGGGDSAITEALHLTKFASKVYVIHRRNQLRASKILQERAFSEPKIEMVWDSVVEKIEGEGLVDHLQIKNVKTKESSTLNVTGIFISIGFKPDTAYLKDIISLDDIGHIITNESMETSIPGILAAGDIRHNSARQAIAAAGDGATAAIYAEKYLTEK